MRMFFLTFVLFGAFELPVVHTQGTYCTLEDTEKIKSSCTKSFVCRLKVNDTCRVNEFIDCMDLKLKNCTFHKIDPIWLSYMTAHICEFGGVDVRSFVKDASCSQNASYCTDDFHRMWRNNMTDLGLIKKFDEMKTCLVNLFGSELCRNETITTNLEDLLDNPFKGCNFWDSGSTSVSPNTTMHGGSTPTRSYGLLSAFTIMMAFILALFH